MFLKYNKLILFEETYSTIKSMWITKINKMIQNDKFQLSLQL